MAGTMKEESLRESLEFSDNDTEEVVSENVLEVDVCKAASVSKCYMTLFFVRYSYMR